MSHAGHNTVFDKNCTDCILRYPREFEHVVWLNFRKMDNIKEIDGKKYYIDVQELLCKKYNITLLNYLTVKERRRKKFREFITKIKGWLDKLHVQNQQRKGKKKKSKSINFGLSMSEKNYESITGRTTGKDLDFISGRGQKPNMSYITGSNKKKHGLSYIIGNNQKKPKMSYITGSNKKKPKMSHITGKNKKKPGMEMITSKREKRDLSGLLGNSSSRDFSGLLGNKKRKGFSL